MPLNVEIVLYSKFSADDNAFKALDCFTSLAILDLWLQQVTSYPSMVEIVILLVVTKAKHSFGCNLRYSIKK